MVSVTHSVNPLNNAQILTLGVMTILKDELDKWFIKQKLPCKKKRTAEWDRIDLTKCIQLHSWSSNECIIPEFIQEKDSLGKISQNYYK